MDFNILIISLASSFERRAAISKQLNILLDIPYSFLDATEGRLISDEWIEDNISEYLKNIYYKKKHFSVNRNTLACADSHRRAQLIAHKFTEGYTLILEDDVVLSKNFGKKIREVTELMDKHSIDLAFPGYGWFNGSFIQRHDIKPSNLGFSLFQYPLDGRITGAYAYIINSLGAEKLVNENIVKIQDTADSFYIKEKELEKSTVVLFPKLVTTGYLPSDIGYSTVKMTYKQKIKKTIYSLSMRSNFLFHAIRYYKERSL